LVSWFAVISSLDTPAAVLLLVGKLRTASAPRFCTALLRRPVILAGLFMRPTSVDLGMAVNQLNVTAPHASFVWQSLILENVAPGARWCSSSSNSNSSNNKSRALEYAVKAPSYSPSEMAAARTKVQQQILQQRISVSGAAVVCGLCLQDTQRASTKCSSGAAEHQRCTFDSAPQLEIIGCILL
jgi:hypothetical protein